VSRKSIPHRKEPAVNIPATIKVSTKAILIAAATILLAAGLAFWNLKAAPANAQPGTDPSQGPAQLALSCNYNIAAGNVVNNATCSLQMANSDFSQFVVADAPAMQGELHGTGLRLRGIIVGGQFDGKALVVHETLNSQQLAESGTWSIGNK
jgi:hypothetical protein